MSAIALITSTNFLSLNLMFPYRMDMVKENLCCDVDVTIN